MTRPLRLAAPAWLLVLLALAGPPAPAQEAKASPVAGRWKFRLPQGPRSITFLFAFTQAEGKWAADFIGSSARLKKEPKFTRFTVDGNAVQFTLDFPGLGAIDFDGTAAADGKKLGGTFSQSDSPLQLTELYPSKLKTLDDAYELTREDLGQLPAGEALFEAGFAVLGSAAAKKLPPEEARLVVDKLTKAAAEYGPRWESNTSLKLAGLLADQAGFADIALAQARRAERMIGDATPAATQVEVYDALTRALTKAGKADEAKKYAALGEKLAAKEYAEYSKKSLTFDPEAFAGRAAKSDRVALLEVFTGAECPPCVGVDLACDGLLKAFKETDLIVLNYHLHVPAGDPLTAPDTSDRVASYGEQITGAPAVFLNGKPATKGGGPAAAAKAKFAEFRKQILPVLETPATAKLTLAVAPAEKGYAATATVSDLAAPGAKVFLRFALVEDVVRYPGGNGILYHHNVVRAMPGGAKGVALTKKFHEQAVAIDPADVRAKITQSLDEYVKGEGEFPHPERPLDLKKLKLVAFVQDDATGEVLQAALVALEAKK